MAEEFGKIKAGTVITFNDVIQGSISVSINYRCGISGTNKTFNYLISDSVIIIGQRLVFAILGQDTNLIAYREGWLNEDYKTITVTQDFVFADENTKNWFTANASWITPGPEQKTYKGKISGTGNVETRENEITGDKLAVFRNFIIGYKDGVLKYGNHDFSYFVNGNTVRITDGMCFAYGYFAYCFAKEFSILPPVVENYYVIYARIDRSVIPNTVELLIKNNYASPNIGINSFRQDVLSTIKTGVYEIPLWIFKATNKGVDTESFVNFRPLREKIKRAEYSDYTSKTVLYDSYSEERRGHLENGVTATTQPTSDNSTKVATTSYVQAAIKEEINR